MTKDEKHTIIPSTGDGIFYDLSIRLKLIIRLLSDPRVNVFLKLLPIGLIFYLFIPDIVPGPIDDAAVIWFGTYIFIELCPQDIVEEHYKKLTQEIPGEWKSTLDVDDEVVDAEWKEK